MSPFLVSSLPSLTCVNLAVWFGSSSCSVIYTAAVFQFKPASLLSLCVSDYVIHRGSVWSSSSIPPLFDHETLGVLSVRMKSCGCRGKHTRMHTEEAGKHWNPHKNILSLLICICSMDDSREVCLTLKLSYICELVSQSLRQHWVWLDI